jgi:tetratricopeptide (TPR) repeat protein
VRITANLLQASPEKHLWAESYESEIGDILTLQRQVAQAVAREIQIQLTPEEQKLLGKTRPVNPKAHDDYLRGRYLCGQDAIQPINKAIPYFQQAIEEAPADPLPYAGLAVCYSLWGWGGDIFVRDPLPKEMMQKARDAAFKAVQLDDDLAEAHTSLAVVALLDWNWPAAEREFKRAIELNPNYSPAHLWYAHYLVTMRRFDESVAEAKRSLELDPFSPFTMDFAAWAFHLARHDDLTIDESRKSLELIPEFPWAHYNLWQTYNEAGRASEAVQEFTKAEEGFGMPQNRLAELRSAYTQSGEMGYWRKVLSFCQEASRQPRNSTRTSGYGWCDYVQNADLAAVQARLGQFDAAFGSLERAYANHEVELIYLNVDPRLKHLRSDPRFQDLSRRVGLPQ